MSSLVVKAGPEHRVLLWPAQGQPGVRCRLGERTAKAQHGLKRFARINPDRDRRAHVVGGMRQLGQRQPVPGPFGGEKAAHLRCVGIRSNGPAAALMAKAEPERVAQRVQPMPSMFSGTRMLEPDALPVKL